MFSGIVEATSRCLHVEETAAGLQMTLERPSFFDDYNIGDSVSHDGVCLTLESFDSTSYKCTLGAETLKVTQWTQESLLNKTFNLERSLRLTDRVHGHFVLGHVDTTARLVKVIRKPDHQDMTLAIPDEFLHYIWRKGSIAINGVSLTINNVDNNQFQVLLIPETLKRTNLEKLNENDLVCIEFDQMARALVRWNHLSRAGREE